MRGLEGKVALISGAARGMGAAAARRLVEEGAQVVLGDLLDADGKALAEDLAQVAAAFGRSNLPPGRSGAPPLGARRAQATFVHLDVTSEDDWAEAVAAAERVHGRLDVLVNNAGILKFAALPDTTTDDYRAVVEVNQLGVFFGMRAAVPALRRSGGGSIVNISSVEGLGGGGFLTAYTASKFAVRGMTKAAAVELGREGIRVNSVHPGAIRTAMVLAQTGGNPDAEKWMAKQVALKRMGEPDEVAALVAFLASDDSSYCTGAEFVVDGGATASSGFKV